MARSWTVIGSLDDIPLDGIDAVAADVDYTLVDFGRAHDKAVSALRGAYGKRFGAYFQDHFELVLDGSRKLDEDMWEYRGLYQNLLSQMRRRQKVADESEVKKWSRETWIEIIGVILNRDFSVAEIAVARDLYWETLNSSAVPYPDALSFRKEVETRRTPVVLMTSSDSVLRETPEGFQYDADFARSYKERRLRALPFPVAGTVIGDPIDKPHPLFFDQVDAVMDGMGFTDRSRIVAVGDSPHSDLEEPAKRGYKTYHIKRF